MLERNAEYLQTKVLRDLGLETTFTEPLRFNMKIGEPVFHLSANGKDRQGNEAKVELTNFVKKDDYYMLNGPAKVTTKDPTTGQDKVGVFRLYIQKGFSMNEMLYIMSGNILYKPSRENNEEVHRIHFLSSQPGPLKKRTASNKNQEQPKADEAFTAARIFGSKEPVPIKQQSEQEMKEYHVSSYKFKLSDLARKFNDLPGINASQEQIERMMRTVLLGGTVDAKLTLPSTGERVDSKITLSKGAGLNVKDGNGNYLNLKSETVEFTPYASQEKSNTNSNAQGDNTQSHNNNQRQTTGRKNNRQPNSGKAKQLMDNKTQQQSGRKQQKKRA